MREYDGWFPRVSIITTLLDKDSPSLFRLSGDFPVGLRKGRFYTRGPGVARGAYGGTV